MASNTAHQLFPYPAEFLFSLVSDIESYPQFVPGWEAVTILQRQSDHLLAEQKIELLGLYLQFRSTAHFDSPRQIDIQSLPDPTQPFDQFSMRWLFNSLSGTETLVEVQFSIRFHSRIMDGLARAGSTILIDRTIMAFEQRARQLRASGAQ